MAGYIKSLKILKRSIKRGTTMTPTEEHTGSTGICEGCQKRCSSCELWQPNEKPKSKYHVEITPNIWVDVYDVLNAFDVECHAVGHAIKKLLKPGQRGYKDAEQDKREAIASIERSIETKKPL
jgi:hypothetical protein